MRVSLPSVARDGHFGRTVAVLVVIVAAVLPPLRAGHTGTQSSVNTLAQPRLIEVIAGRDSRFKIPGQDKPVITVKAGEPIRLRVTAIKAKSGNRDGSVHGFSLLRVKDKSPVPDWDLLLQPGTQEFVLTAPAEPGEYEVVCTVICSANHEQMTMRFVVVPAGG
jgi:heme/copper-type cytochrome/quinol oxidase subunit 2